MAALIRNHPLLETVNITASEDSAYNLGATNALFRGAYGQLEAAGPLSVPKALQELVILCCPTTSEAQGQDNSEELLFVGTVLDSLLESSGTLEDRASYDHAPLLYRRPIAKCLVFKIS